MEHHRISISPIAYIKSLMYFQRFSSEFIGEENFKFSYALLVGYLNPFKKKTYITDFVPIKEYNKENINFKKDPFIFEKIAKVNLDYDDEEFPEFVIGWARNSLYNDLEPTDIDKQNHLVFQTAIEPQALFWVFNYDNLMIDDGFRLYIFDDDFKSINMVTPLAELKYNFSNKVFLDELIEIAINIEEKRKTKAIVIKGIEEN